MPTIPPAIMEICGELVKYGVREVMVHHAKAPVAAGVVSDPIIVTAPKSGCPACAVATQLATVHRYLTRAESKPSFRDVYIELARLAIKEALVLLEDVPASLDRVRLAGPLTRLEVSVAVPVPDQALPALAKQAWALSDIALDIAESGNTPQNTEAANGS